MYKLKDRVLEACKKHNFTPDVLIKAPGRINLIGEHTDYNQGFVLPAAIDKCFVYGLSKNDTDKINLYALDLKESITISIGDFNKRDRTWVNFILGLLVEIKTKGFEISGFDCVLTSDIPFGSGMSSSSGLECGFIAGLNELFDLKLKPWEMIEMSHHSNHTFLGVKGGILDQFSSFFGMEDQCMLLDCRDYTFDYMPIEIPGYQFVLYNTNVQHDHVTGGYNRGPRECAELVSLLQSKGIAIESLRDVTLSHLNDTSIPNHLIERARFIISENDRVHQFAQHLKDGNITELGQLLYASHEGLKTDYKVSCDELDLLVELVQKESDVAGGRMMGGGFGGCTINLVKASAIEEVTQRVLAAYEQKTGIIGESYTIRISDGVAVL